jgi:hypothetical protein
MLKKEEAESRLVSSSTFRLLPVGRGTGLFFLHSQEEEDNRETE